MVLHPTTRSFTNLSRSSLIPLSAAFNFLDKDDDRYCRHIRNNQNPNVTNVYMMPTCLAKNIYAKKFIIGPAKRIGKKESPFSTEKRSAEIKEMSLPEFVSVIDFMDRFTTLS